SAQVITPRYLSACLSNQVLNPPIARVIGLRDSPLCGSTPHHAESIGVSVKETNSEIITAHATVSPNSKKNLPMMPPMNATGTNTATMDSVVASTARTISRV